MKITDFLEPLLFDISRLLDFSLTYLRLYVSGLQNVMFINEDSKSNYLIFNSVRICLPVKSILKLLPIKIFTFVHILFVTHTCP